MGAKSGHPKKNSKVAASKLKEPKSAGKADKLAKKIESTKKKKTTSIIDGRLKTGLDPNLVDKAVDALLNFHEKQTEEKEKSSLLGNDRAIQVQFTLLRAPGQSSPKPIRILIPNPLYKLADSNNDGEEEEPEICLIVKEESKPWCQEMISKFPDHMGCVKKVLGLQSLRKKHAQYAQKRELLKKYNLFMADDRILPMLSKSLGKEFFKAKKLPIPINLTRKEALPFTIQKALSATFMTVSSGTCINVRAGHTGMASKKIVENIVGIASNAPLKIPHKWANIQMISIKTPESVALPIYNKTPEILKEIGKLAGIEEKQIPDETEEAEATKSETDKDKGKTREMKSPLLKALKKQKKEEKAKKHKDEDAMDNGEATNAASKVARKKKRSSSEGSSNEAIESPEKKKRVETKTMRDEEGKGSKKKAKADKADKSTTKEAHKKKKSEEAEKSSSKKKKVSELVDDDGKKKEFIAAKRFKKSIDGYVFKMGAKGLGYYIDHKPVVNKLAIEAIIRMGKQNSSRRGGRRGNRRF